MIKNEVSEVLTFALVNYLLMDINKFDAIKMKLIDNKGNILKEPETDKEKIALNPFVIMIIKIKHMLGGRLNDLHRFIALKSYGKSSTDTIINSLYRASTNVTALNKLQELIDEESGRKK